MITVTDAAREEIIKLMEKQEQPVKGVRIKAEALSPLQANFRLRFVADDQEEATDVITEFEGFNIYVDPESVSYVQEVTVDFVESLAGRGFKIENANKVPAHLKGTVAEKVQAIIDEKINPQIASHGGHLSLLDVKENTAYVQFGGGCQGCGMADVTLKQGVEVLIKEACPDIEEILDVTDHADGKNPYFQGAH
ncbi:MAG: Fe/S biogenesis protein NfuA [Gemmatimonadetes bacterium]|nr:Fe/S biogenesis protein NfuA [Gemmatimonadota bacterium]|tara:strand:- start:1829 stop:2410 length:582 start_codon:yes stop_codon:yes gene_type:complete